MSQRARCGGERKSAGCSTVRMVTARSLEEGHGEDKWRQ